MTELLLESEMVSAQGGATAELMTNSITASNNEMTRILLRESLQNSCDQRLNMDLPVRFIVETYRFDEQALERLKQLFSRPSIPESKLNILETLENTDVYGLQIVDGNTRGLCGNVDASIASITPNFANFFFKIGRSSDQQYGGGSYGLGRSIFFAASECNTAIAYSRFHEEGQLKSRLMAMTYSPTFTHNGREYSGRHWWCERVTDKVTYPVEGIEADAIADDLGLSRHFHQSTGTAILVLAPKALSRLNEDYGQTPRHFTEELQRASELFAWPHYVDQSVQFSFLVDGVQLEERSIESLPVLRDYADAYRAQSQGGSQELPRDSQIHFAGISETSPLGRLTWNHKLRNRDDIEIENSDGIPLSSVALMRGARFIVKYLPVTPIRDGLTTRAVFIADPKFEQIFRQSEPVAHDDWLPAKLGRKKGERNEIRQALEKIAKEFKSAALVTESENADSKVGVEIANRLGKLAAGIGVTGPRYGPDDFTGHNKSRSGNKKIIEIGTPQIIATSSASYEVEFNFQFIQSERSTQDKQISIEAGIRDADGGKETAGQNLELTVLVDGIKTRSATFEIDLLGNEGLFSVRLKVPSRFSSYCSASIAKTLDKEEK